MNIFLVSHYKSTFDKYKEWLCCNVFKGFHTLSVQRTEDSDGLLFGCVSLIYLWVDGHSWLPLSLCLSSGLSALCALHQRLSLHISCTGSIVLEKDPKSQQWPVQGHSLCAPVSWPIRSCASCTVPNFTTDLGLIFTAVTHLCTSDILKY